MCTPAGHTLMGIAVGGPLPKRSDRKFWLSLAGILILANLPDADFLLGIPTGNPNRYHHGWTHSLGFVLMVMFLSGAVSLGFKKRLDWTWIMFSGLIVLSHLVLDYFTLDRSAPYGLQLFWPVSKAYVISPVVLFRDVQKSSTNATFIPSLFSAHNALTILSELVIFLPMVALRYFLKRR
jgi:inner membrane protein